VAGTAPAPFAEYVSGYVAGTPGVITVRSTDLEIDGVAEMTRSTSRKPVVYGYRYPGVFVMGAASFHQLFSGTSSIPEKKDQTSVPAGVSG
jgi:hypothetical protein